MAKAHAHLICQSCERVFCTDDSRYATMAEGDTCPSCHVATVVSLPDVLPEVPEEVQREMQEALHLDMNARYLMGLLRVAMELFPYMTRDTMETLPQRAEAAVEMAFLMEELIAKRLHARAQENLDLLRSVDFPGEQPSS